LLISIVFSVFPLAVPGRPDSVVFPLLVLLFPFPIDEGVVGVVCPDRLILGELLFVGSSILIGDGGRLKTIFRLN
jgi:hypothetical protein